MTCSVTATLCNYLDLVSLNDRILIEVSVRLLRIFELTLQFGQVHNTTLKLNKDLQSSKKVILAFQIDSK